VLRRPHSLRSSRPDLWGRRSKSRFERLQPGLEPEQEASTSSAAIKGFEGLRGSVTAKVKVLPRSSTVEKLRKNTDRIARDEKKGELAGTDIRSIKTILRATTGDNIERISVSIDRFAKLFGIDHLRNPCFAGLLLS
jgi:hypothetical protein